MWHSGLVRACTALQTSLRACREPCKTDKMPSIAVCVLQNSDGKRRGVVVMEEVVEGGWIAGLRFLGTVEGLTPGLHGFHVHESGDLRLGCASLCAHFNPTHSQHGGPRSARRHLGDLGNVFADEHGVARVALDDPHLRLTGPHGIIGRSLVVHAQRDDLGRGPGPDSLVTGNSGPRVLCGVIGWGPAAPASSS